MRKGIKSKNNKANFQSVLISIQRYYDRIKLTKSSYEQFLKENLPKAELITKNKIITLTFERTKKVMDSLNEISKSIRWDLGNILLYIQGIEEVTIITDEKHKEKFNFLKKYLLEEKENLATISFREPEGKLYSKEVVGVLSFLTRILADNDINIYEIASTYKQLIFVIHKKDLTKAHNILDNLINN